MSVTTLNGVTAGRVNMTSNNRILRRSDEIRRRRMNQSHQARHTPVQRKGKVAMHMPPPVMTRGSTYGKAQLENKSLRKTRRRYDVPLSAQGAEMRLPSLPQVRIGWRVASFLFIVLLSYGLYQLWSSPRFRVDEVQVIGLHRLTSGEVNTVMGVTGKQVFMLDATSIQNGLTKNFPEFSAVAVQIDLPNTMVITVTERVPVLIWKQDGHSYLVDKEGTTFPMRDDKAGITYPAIEATGDPPSPVEPDPAVLLTPTPQAGDLVPLPTKTPELVGARPLLSPEMVLAILVMAQKAPESAILIYDPVHGLGWKDQRGWDVFFGDMQDIEVKLQVYNTILEQLKKDDTKPELINVEYVHAPYYRLAQ
jgi:hypothetical protein